MFSKPTKIILIILLVAMIISGVIVPWLNVRLHKQNIAYRGSNLKAWYEGVRLFILKNNCVPSSLYEVYHDRVKEGDADMSSVVSLVAKLFGEDVQSLPDDPQKFEESVRSGLRSDRYGWVIRELRHGRMVFPGMLMIDQDGIIYQVQEISIDD